MSSIINTADLNSYTGKTLTAAVATQVVKAVNQWIESRTGRCWGDTATATESHDWKPHIWLHHQDVHSITSVKFGYDLADQITIDPTTYRVNKLGRLSFGGYRNRNSFRYADYPDSLEIAYTYGVDEVPDDLKLAALGIAAGFYNWASNGQQEIVSAQVGSYRVDYSGRFAGSEGSNPANSTPDANFAIVASYATKRF